MQKYRFGKERYIKHWYLGVTENNDRVQQKKIMSKKNRHSFAMSGFHESTFVYSSFFSKIEFLYCLLNQILIFGSPDPWKMHFQHTFWFQRISYPWLINTIFLCEYYGSVIKYMKSHHPNRCIKLVTNLPRLPSLWIIPFFFVTRHDQVIRPCLIQTFPFYIWANIFQFQ